MMLAMSSSLDQQDDLEQQLERSRRWLAEAHRLAALGAWEWDVAKDEVRCSDELYRLFRLPEKSVEPTFEACLAMVHPEDQGRAQDAIMDALAGSDRFDFDHRVCTGDGSLLWVRTRGSVTRDESGQPVLLVATAQDITDRIASEARLQESERRLLEAQRVARLGRWDWDVLEDRVTWSEEMYRIFGLDPQAREATYADYLERIHPDDRERVDLVVQQAWDGKDVYEVDHRIVRADGSVGWVAGRGEIVRDDRGRPLRFHGTATDVTERKRAEAEAERSASALAAQAEQLRRLAFTDPLTGLANRALFNDRLEHAVARREREQVSVLLLDLDDFKHVNDLLGHQVGDELLAEVARRLQGCVRPQDTVARLGGDEFAVVLESDADPELVVRRVTEALEEPAVLGERQLVPTASTGLATTDSGSIDAEELLRRADIAMYEAKRAGKGRYAVFQPSMTSTLQARADLEAGLRGAVQRDEIVVHYQPIVDVRAGRVVRVEALVRWQRPDGMVMPTVFLPVAEQSGWIRGIGQRVLERTCSDLGSWLTADQHRSVAVNVSPVQLREPDFAADVLAAVAECCLLPSQLVLEVTESVFLDAGPVVVAQLDRLRAAGVLVAIDDFGTGYSSLGRLQALPVDSLKVDRSFVEGVGDPSAELPILTSLLVMAHALDLDVTAEGVETPLQATRLVSLGADFLQGHHLSPPVPGAELLAAVEAADVAAAALHGP